VAHSFISRRGTWGNPPRRHNFCVLDDILIEWEGGRGEIETPKHARKGRRVIYPFPLKMFPGGVIFGKLERSVGKYAEVQVDFLSRVWTSVLKVQRGRRPKKSFKTSKASKKFAVVTVSHAWGSRIKRVSSQDDDKLY